MTAYLHSLAANLAVVAVFFAGWALALDRLSRYRRRWRALALGLFMALGAVASMNFAIDVAPGVIFDLRSVPITVAALFGGPAAGLIASSAAAGLRLALGGVGASSGVAAICLVTAVGLAGHLLTRGRPGWRAVVVVSATTAAVPPVLVGLTLPSAGLGEPVAAVALSILVATVAAGLVIRQAQRAADERDLLQKALTQAPDFHYVKDRASVIVMANQTVARYHGFASPEQMTGKTDFDLDTHGRAQDLFEAEQKLMLTGASLLDQVDRTTGKDGQEHWFQTSKVALRNVDGETIGLAGVTRDITRHHRMEAALVDSRNLLSYAVEGMADALAMFDRGGYLVYCNERYRSFFPLTAEVRQPGVHITDILRRVADTGEQVIQGDAADWVQKVAASLSQDGEQQICLYDGRWLRVQTRPTEHGAAMVVFSDVTTFKQAEGELRSLTSQLKLLAETDGLTGLMNRRSFDMRIADEVARSEREQRPLSVVLFDVNSFKAYNDTLGHPAGDECLKIVAGCVRASLLREADVAARYGGEEFVAILPDTDEDSAYRVAERARRALSELRLPHAGAATGIVTISAGIASYAAKATPRSGAQLVGRADEALYDAKHAGRNRVMGWRPSRHAAAG